MRANFDVQLWNWFLVMNSCSTLQIYMKFTYIVTGLVFLLSYWISDNVSCLVRFKVQNSLSITYFWFCKPCVFHLKRLKKNFEHLSRGILLSSCIPSSSQHQCCVSLVIFSYLEGPWSLKGSLTKTLRLSLCVCILKETMLG